MKQCIKKHLPKNFADEINTDIFKLHMTISEVSFDSTWNELEDKWNKIYHLEDFVKYFKKQWINSIFSRWQIYHTDAGLATTNNPLEQYNKIIKTNFTSYLSMNIIPCLEAFEILIDYESKQIFYNYTHKSATKLLIELSKKINKAKFRKQSDNEFTYTHR